MIRGVLPVRTLRPLYSRLVAAWYNGPDHPAKIRIFDWLMRLAGQPRLIVPYAGGRLSVDVEDLVARTILTQGAYEPEVWVALAPHVPPRAVVWDAGGHIGSFAVRAMLDPRVAQVHTFEPDPKQYHILQYNLSLNSGTAHAHNLALSSTTGTVRFQPAPAANTGLGRISATAGDAVAATTIDRLVFDEALPAPDILKIDVEGSEPDLLAGARRLLAERPPRAIAIEVDYAEAQSGRGPALDLLTAHGYRCRHITRPDGHTEKRENVLAVRPVDTVPSGQ